jgi:hypothetical protein
VEEDAPPSKKTHENLERKKQRIILNGTCYVRAQKQSLVQRRRRILADAGFGCATSRTLTITSWNYEKAKRNVKRRRTRPSILLCPEGAMFATAHRDMQDRAEPIAAALPPFSAGETRTAEHFAKRKHDMRAARTKIPWPLARVQVARWRNVRVVEKKLEMMCRKTWKSAINARASTCPSPSSDLFFLLGRGSNVREDYDSRRIWKRKSFLP